ncbi:MAG: DUF3095 domain-containing protein [Pseudanabaena sp.]|nr:MAG: DUF3095 domain-containing protein [Pseudanabaena sp.]
MSRGVLRFYSLFDFDRSYKNIWFENVSSNQVWPNVTTTDNFYAELVTLKNFSDITYIENFQTVPDDWMVIVTDIVGSTKAIQSGRYKDVNLLGACSIIVILNLVGELEIPFVFGGDGASMLVPSKFASEVEQILIAVEKMAKDEFNLEMRTGLVPVAEISPTHDILIAKLQISENYSQAILRGGGISYATNLIKNVATRHLYSPKSNNSSVIADFSGLECRWRDIPSRHEEILSLIVMVTAPSQSQIDNFYREVIKQIERIYGEDAECHPVTSDNLQLAFRANSLSSEMRVFTTSADWLKKYLYLWKLRLINLLGTVLMRFNIKLGGFNWGDYKQIVTESTDFKKFDDILRMVISGTSKQRDRLIDVLEKKFKEGRLVYGYHISDRALMTCLVFERDGRQVHFIDGADGGYAIAAADMKERMKS